MTTKEVFEENKRLKKRLAMLVGEGLDLDLRGLEPDDVEEELKITRGELFEVNYTLSCAIEAVDEALSCRDYEEMQSALYKVKNILEE